MSNERTDRLVGTVLDGRFRLDDVIGAGGMGKVYAGVQLSVDRPVAVKVLREELSESETLTRRFFREAKVVASLRHSNVVGLVDFGRDEELGLLYIAMEYIDGVSLARLLRRGRLEVPLVVAIARQVCSALAEAHAAGVIHRDLKPDNVMLVTTAEGALSVKVLDFGIALPTGEEARLTSTGAVVGTPHYMAPEQAQDRPITERSDIYSLGVLIYEMLTGRLPFVADTPMAVLLKVITQPPSQLTEVLEPAQLPPASLNRLMGAMLSKDPAGRPENIAAVAGALDQITRSENLVTPTVSTQDGLDGLVVERASDEFVNARTVDSPVPTPNSEAAVPPVSTVGEMEQPGAISPPTLDRPAKKRWPWFIIPLVFVGCCCFPVVNVWIDNAARQASGGDVITDSDTGATTGETIGETIGEDSVPPEPIDLGHAVADDVPDAALEPPPAREVAGETRPPQRLRGVPKPPSLPPSGGPSKVEADGSVLSGSRGGTCNGTKDCSYTGGTVGCGDSSTCVARCPRGGCAQTAHGASSADFFCEGGGCTQTCLSDANCDMRCAGGTCTQVCATKGKCDVSCSDGCTKE